MTATSTDTYDQIGIREDLSDNIWDISPEEVPFTSSIGKGDADNTFFEWQTDELEAVNADTAIEGADATFAPASPTVRIGNYTEILERTAITSGTLEATDRAGRAREMAYQVVKRAKEIKRSWEFHVVGLNQERIAGSDVLARKTASYLSWVATNTDFGVGGADPTGDGTDARVDGTQRPFTEDLLGVVIDSIWEEGGNPDCIMVGSFNKRAVSGFSGNTSQGGVAGNVTHENTDKKVINAVSVYESDYNVIQVVPNRFMRTRDALVFEKDMWSVSVLRGMRNYEIAKTGDNFKRQVLMECGLRSKNEKASGIVADLTDA